MAKLLCDLGKDSPNPRPGAPLTQAALDSYNKQLRSDQCPASTSIISYLKRLEMDHVIPHTGDQPDPGTTSYGKDLTSDPSHDGTVSKGHRPENGVPSIPHYSPQKLTAETNSGSCYGIGEEYKPDETTYLPLASSPHKASFVPSPRPTRTSPKVCSGERDVATSPPGVKTDATNMERNTKSQRSLFGAPDKPTRIHEPNIPPSGDPSQTRPPLLQHLRNLQLSGHILSDRATCEVTSDWSIASFSTFTSHDEQDFRNGLAALDANIAKLQRTLQSAGRT